MAEVEDQMWYYRALHRHVARASCRSTAAGCRRARCRLRHRRTIASPANRATNLATERIGFFTRSRATRARPHHGRNHGGFGPTVALRGRVLRRDHLLRGALPSTRSRGGAPGIFPLPETRRPRRAHDAGVPMAVLLSRPPSRQLTARLAPRGQHTHAHGETAPTSSTYWNTLPFPLAVLRRKIFPPADPTSDVRLYPAPLEAMFNAMMASEHIWIHAGGHLPFGSSVLVVARKPDHA